MLHLINTFEDFQISYLIERLCSINTLDLTQTVHLIEWVHLIETSEYLNTVQCNVFKYIDLKVHMIMSKKVAFFFFFILA